MRISDWSSDVCSSDLRVLAQDIVAAIRDRLASRVERERLDNVSVKLGEPLDPKLPGNSFDRIFLVNMYHEIQQPYAFLWHLHTSLKPGGQIVVVDKEATTDQHGTPPRLLMCEFAAVGYRRPSFKEQLGRAPCRERVCQYV